MLLYQRPHLARHSVRFPRLPLLLCVMAMGTVAFAATPTVYVDKPTYYEGDACTLPGSPPRTGICTKALDCRRGVGRNSVYCTFSRNDAVVCCPPAGDSANGQELQPSTNRITAGYAKQECEHLQSRSALLVDHLSGNRKEVWLGEFPFMALVNYDPVTAANVRCGAALISKRFLLTAAHCFRERQPVSVTLGAVVKDDKEAAVYAIKQVHNHDNYMRRQNDLALIELTDDVAFDSHISPICLYHGQQDIDPTVNLTVMGWGLDGYGQNTNQLFKGTVSRVSLDQCRAKFSDAMLRIPATDKIMCALGERSSAGDYTDSCEGDSGGPLIMSVQEKFYLVGVVSFGTVCGSAIPGIYTRVPLYIDWIERNVWGAP